MNCQPSNSSTVTDGLKDLHAQFQATQAGIEMHINHYRIWGGTGE